MTTPPPLHRTRRGLIAAAFSGSLLAVSAIVTAGTGTAAAAPSPVADILNAVCFHYEPNPVSNPDNPAENRVSDCRAANLTYANLTGANLTGANLTYASLTDANLYETSLYRTTLTRVNLTRTNLTRTNLTDANLYNANLTDAFLTYANLNYANLNYANLNYANLTGSSVIPGNVSVPATSADGAAVTWAAPALPFGVLYTSCDHSAGTQFPIGPTLVTCTVGTASGAGTGTFTVNVNVSTQAPAFADAAPVALTGTVGTELIHTLDVTGTPAPTLTATGLPDWLTLTDGVLTGTPVAAGRYTFLVVAANGTAPDATAAVTVTVALASGPPATGSLGSLN
ncbi:pentapeptide repeat-containing protein [Rhodococcus qingshengii]|uniref:pentapeptide repeat-containing protein n=1 Tax=Rhodococcus qingshengii TaxID=334542 RepID=UPI003662B775